MDVEDEQNPYELNSNPDGVKSISIKGWTVSCLKKPIFNTEEIDSASHQLDIPLPEMIFGHNQVSISHESDWTITFSTLDALDLVDKHDRGNLLKVAYSESWQKQRYVDCLNV